MVRKIGANSHTLRNFNAIRIEKSLTVLVLVNEKYRAMNEIANFKIENKKFLDFKSFSGSLESSHLYSGIVKTSFLYHGTFPLMF
jgi:hypothetical protein